MPVKKSNKLLADQDETGGNSTSTASQESPNQNSTPGKSPIKSDKMSDEKSQVKH